MLTTDDFQEIKEKAEARVQEIAVRAFENMPGDHAKLFAQVGKEKYGEYAAAMEKMRRSQGG